MDNIIKLLNHQANEIATNGHAGWGNTMIMAADRIKELEEQLRVSREAHSDTMNGQAVRIKELEEEFNKQVEMRNKLTIIKFELEARIKELEEMLAHYEATLDYLRSS